MRKRRFLYLLAAFFLFQSGCAAPGPGAVKAGLADREVPGAVPAGASSSEKGGTAPKAGKSGKTKSQGKTDKAKKIKRYQAPEFAGSAFHPEMAQGDSNVQIDVSAVQDGYVAVAAWSAARLKFQTMIGDSTYTYDIASDGTPSVFPLQGGNGIYTFRVMENVVDDQYVQLFCGETEVVMSDGFQPFLRPSAYVNYGKDSKCVKKGAELAKKAESALDLVGEVYSYICGTVDYDHEKAANVRSGYLPDPDETMETGLGICFDYASLAAAMLRSQGIPAKVIFGYVSPDNLYHAWNMFYTKETGWVTVGFKAEKDQWTRMDLTFAANGADSTFIGNGENYMDVYMY